jgi:hypothetical protein
LKSAFYIGQSKYVGGVVTDMVAVANDNVQAELWIGADDGLPRMARVSYPKDPLRASYDVQFSNWKLGTCGVQHSARGGLAAHGVFAPGRPGARQQAMRRREMNGKLLLVAAAVGLALTVPASAWRGGGFTPSGGHWGFGASGGHWGGSWNGHTGGGSYGTTSSGAHYATSDKGGSFEAQNGSWSATSASGKTDYGSYGTTAYGTHYATGAYGGTMAKNGDYWGASKNGEYAYGTSGYHTTGTYGSYSGAYHPPATVNNYYGTGCWNCGGWSNVNDYGAGLATGLAAGTMVGAAAASSAAAAGYAAGAAAAPPPPAPYVAGTIYAALPTGCLYEPTAGKAYYLCNNTWFSPYYGANGLYYRVVANPM